MTRIIIECTNLYEQGNTKYSIGIIHEYAKSCYLKYWLNRVLILSLESKNYTMLGRGEMNGM